MTIVKSGGEAAPASDAPMQELEQDTSTQDQGQLEQDQAPQSGDEPEQGAGAEEVVQEPGRGETSSAVTLDEPAEVPSQEAPQAAAQDEPLGADGTPAIQVLAQEQKPQTSEEQFRDVLALFPEETQRYIVAFLTSDELISREAMQNILSYVRYMSPTTPNTPETGGQWQATLYHTLTGIINRGCGEWNTFYGVFLQIVNALKTNHVFKATMINRFLEEAPLTASDRRAFTRLMHVFVTTSDPATRSLSVRQVNLDAAMKEGVIEAGRQRVKAYYS